MTTTQNCAECGTRAEPGQSFCDACGAVLSWTDREGKAGRAAGAPSGATAGPREGRDTVTDSPGAGGDPRAASGGPGRVSTATAGSEEGAGASPAAPDSGAPVTPSGPPASADPGWDAFSRPDGGTGLARTPRDLLVAGTASAVPDTETRTAPDPGDDHPAPEAPSPASAPRPAPESAEAPAPPNSTPPTDDTASTEPVPAAAATTPIPEVSSAPDTPVADDGMTDRARRLLVPVDDPEPRPAAAPSVAPVLPGRPAPQRPQVVRAPGEDLGADGGTPCPWCGTRNRPDRHFCTRCAMPMAGEAQAPGRLPWWRRLFGAGNRETPWAGDRPRLRRAFDRVLTWVGAAVVLTLLIVGAVNLPQGIQATRDHFSKRAPVDPDGYSASRSYPGHKPALAFDKLSNTWWGPGVSESGQGQWIEARFDQPTRLLDLIITPGVSTRAEQLQQSARPHRIEATVTLADGKKITRQLNLDQGPGGQREPFRVGKVTAVRFTIESAYGADATKQVAIAEIEFFGPSNANSS
ncbi:NADase-type glycan-binding domain-containing protein [Streptomyces sp. NPDC101152]|uniref:NADase-type glycan-binding domain-containing protein n=1 Tax=Streptomyces sp. NPDC101152 TaxID=3366116 RepID=UPI003821B5A3